MGRNLGNQDVGVIQFLQPFRGRFFGKNLIEDGLDSSAVEITGRIIAAFGVVLHIFDAHDLTESRPALIIYSRNAHVAVTGAERAPDPMQKRMPSAGTFG